MNPAYDEQAPALAAHYEQTTFEAVHGLWLSLLGAPGRALDIGAGSGRDAAALAARGWQVQAAEPSAAMRAEGQRLHPHAAISWCAGGLPALPGVDGPVDLVLLSAVWMHVPPGDRGAAFARLAGLLAPGGLLVITLRRGPDLPGRTFFPVAPDELPALAQRHGLAVARDVHTPDRLGRPDLSWRTVALRAGPAATA